MDELRARYDRQSKAYDELVASTLANPQTASENVKDITALAADMGKTLDEMLTLIVQNSEATQEQRDELLQKLTKIQRDYNGLVQNTDKLETLRRIRAFEDTSWKRTLYIWLMVFCAVVVLIVVLMFVRKKSVNAPTINPVPEIPRI
jgi:hypothetical protein